MVESNPSTSPNFGRPPISKTRKVPPSMLANTCRFSIYMYVHRAYPFSEILEPPRAGLCPLPLIQHCTQCLLVTFIKKPSVTQWSSSQDNTHEKCPRLLFCSRYPSHRISSIPRDEAQPPQGTVGWYGREMPRAYSRGCELAGQHPGNPAGVWRVSSQRGEIVLSHRVVGKVGWKLRPVALAAGRLESEQMWETRRGQVQDPLSGRKHGIKINFLRSRERYILLFQEIFILI